MTVPTGELAAASLRFLAMRGTLTFSVLIFALGLLPGTAKAQGLVGGVASDNIEHLSLFPLDGRANGGKLLGKTLYVTTGKTLQILDVSAPEAPKLLGQLDFELVDGGSYATGYQEDVDTNGKVLIRSEGGEMAVVDVRDPTKPAILGTVTGADDHTMSCVLDCTWVYGSEGTIVDIRDPTKPVVVDSTWSGATETGTTGHDVTEFAPGLVLTASNPMYVLDARSDAANPNVLAAAEAPGFVHGTLWPNQGEGEIMLAGGEALGPSPSCQDSPSSTFHTWDARNWRETKTFTKLDEYRLTPTEQEGATASVWCTHWFDHHRQFGRGGLVTIAWYEQGVRLLKVGGDGKIEQTGYFLPHGGSVWDVRWIDDRIIYSFDHHRGIDILKYTGDIPDPGGQLPGSKPPASSPPPSSNGEPLGNGGSGQAAPAFRDMVKLPKRCGARRSLTIRVKRSADPVTSLTVRAGKKLMRRARGKALKRPVRVKKLPRKAFTLRVDVTTRSGAKASGKRRYAGCR